MESIVSDKIHGAILRLPAQSNSSIERVLENALRLKIQPLADACREELRTRGSLNLNAAEAEHVASIGVKVAGKSLREVIRLAFEEVPAKEEELLILKFIADHPGASYAELLQVYGKNDLSLVIGHLVYYRFGYFRPFLNGSIQSDLLLERESSSGRVCYTLRAETVEALDFLERANQLQSSVIDSRS